MLQLLSRLVLGTGIALAVWEASARIEDWWKEDAPLLGRHDYSVLLTEDEVGVHGRPHAHYAKWRLNSLGYRGPELQPASERLLAIGASETFGLFERAGHEYPRLLENALHQLPDLGQIQVVNVALAGQGLPAATSRIPIFSAQIRPRWAFIYPSLASYISPPPPFVHRAAAQPRSPWHLRVADRIDTLLKRSLPAELQLTLKKLLIWKAVRGQTVLATIPDSRLALFEQDLSELVQALRAHGIAPILITHATRFGPVLQTEDQAMLVSWRKFYPELAEQGFLDMEFRLNQRMREVARRLQTPWIDAAAEMPPGPKMFADFSHFTDEGSQQMASLLARKLQPLLQTGPAPAATATVR